jgi:hypothetical protein
MMGAGEEDRLAPAWPRDPMIGVREAFREVGFTVVEGLFEADELPALRAEADRLLATSSERGGARNILQRSELLRDLALGGAPARAAAEVLDGPPRPTKLTIFDKTPLANWKVPWHQDLTIAVSARFPVDGFGPWSVKGGVVHVQPPIEVLRQTVAVRVHLDDTPASNGALRLLPGTHRLGRVDESSLEVLQRDGREVVCSMKAGSALLMSPLLLHASSAAEVPTRRRVLHFEYSAAQLPADLEWSLGSWFEE